MALSSQQVLKRAQRITFLLLDVDGVLTDGKITLTSDGHEVKSFDIQDGYGLKELARSGVEIGLLSGRRSPIVERRAKELDIDEIHQGISDKLPVYEALIARRGLLDREVAYVGDDVPDLSVLRRVGLAVSVRNGHAVAKRAAHYVTIRRGGEGAVREISDLLLRARSRGVRR
ncbi:MAG: HAD hydrolase family protein [Nitrospirae bacterium]|nr:HAD hydrolase family protein [Nitrospirota bacterium]